MLNGSLVFALIACGPSDADIDAKITERLIAERLIEASPRPAGPNAPPRSAAAPPPLDPVAASHAVLASLDVLMKDYQPDLPTLTDETDVLRCVTTADLKSDPRLKDVGRTLEKERQASERARRDAAATFRRERLPLDYRIDVGWADRTKKESDRYGCWDSGAGQVWMSLGESQCYNMSNTLVWKLRAPGETRPLYVNGGPELMKRIETARVTVPDRISCRVNDVVQRDDHRTVACDGGPEIRVYGDVPLAANVGDLLSVPLKDAKRDPNGVLWKDISGGRWVVDAEVATVKVDDNATCPTIDEILSAGGAR